MDNKICSRCKLEKSKKDFHKSNKTKDNLQAFCKLCNSQCTSKERRQFYNERRKVKRQDPLYKKQEYDKGKQHRIDYRSKYLWKGIKVRSKKNNVPFDIEISDINIPEFCPILGVKMTSGTMKPNDPYSPSIDRIVPELGYIKGNIMIICTKANIMKSNASKEELLKFSQFYLEFWKK